MSNDVADASAEYEKEASNYMLPKGTLIRPFTWEELATVLSVGEDALKRWPANQVAYRHAMNEIKATYCSAEDFILISKFNFTSKYDANGKIYAVPSSDFEPAETILCLNDYPYAVEEDVQHYLLWGLKEIPYEEAKFLLHNKFPPHKFEHIFFVNPPNIQTIKRIHHWQVFVRPRRGELQATDYVIKTTG